jgi:hypothetical protein
MDGAPDQYRGRAEQSLHGFAGCAVTRFLQPD